MEADGLRNGYTTGTCAAVAASAAAWHAFTGEEKNRFSLKLPGGDTVCLQAEKSISKEDGKVWFFVEKDGGDDPDVTSGALIYGAVEPLEKTEESDHWYHSKEYPFLFLTGGPGVGVVTRPGLACPPGYHAINPVPRSMIFQQVGRLYREFKKTGNYLITISIPQGRELAEKTFNPRLGILGGISVLGTSGIVRPMSEQALKDTIRLEIHMRVAAGEDSLIVVPGNYGERFLKETLGISPKWAVLSSNFVADTIEMAVEEGIKKILFIGHIGKLVKVAGGARNTHSKWGDARMEILAESLEAGIREMRGRGETEKAEKAEQLREQILRCNTTEDALEHLEKAGLRETVMEDIMDRIWREMTKWTEGKAEISVLTFSSVYGILGMSSRCEAMLEEWRERQR